MRLFVSSALNPGGSPASTLVSGDISIPNVNLIDGSRWHISVSHQLGSSFSEYSLRIARPTIDNIYRVYSASFVYTSTTDNMLSNFNSTHNPNGPYFCAGTNTTPTSYNSSFLGRTFGTSEESRVPAPTPEA